MSASNASTDPVPFDYSIHSHQSLPQMPPVHPYLGHAPSISMSPLDTRTTPGESHHSQISDGQSRRGASASVTQPRLDRSTSKSHAINPNLAVSDYLDPDDRVFRPGNANAPSLPFFQNHPAPPLGEDSESREFEERHSPVQSEGDDPISLRMLSVAEALRLVELYHEHLNLLCAVLDVQREALRLACCTLD